MPESHPAVVGVLESPLETGVPIVAERIDIRGWAVAHDQEIAEVVAGWRQHGGAIKLTHGLRRRDVLEAWGEWPGAARSGFVGTLPMPPTPDILEVTVRSHAGALLHGWARALTPRHLGKAWPEHARQLHPDTIGQPALPPIRWLVCPGNILDDRTTDTTRMTWSSLGTSAEACEPAWLGVVRDGDMPTPATVALLTRALAEAGTAGDGCHVVIADHEEDTPDGTEPVLKPADIRGWHDHEDIHGRSWLVRAEALGPLDRDALIHAVATGDTRRAFKLALSGTRQVVRLFWPLVRGSSGQGARAQTNTPLPASEPRGEEEVTVVIPSCLAHPALFARCLDALYETTAGIPLDVLVVLNNLRDHTLEQAGRWLARWPVRTIHVDGPFNWSALNNAGLAATSAPWCLLLNDDVEATTPGWLLAMLKLARTPQAGAIGALLRYPDGRIQHGGIGWHAAGDPVCRHVFRDASGQERRLRRWLDHDRRHTAVTGACLLIRRDLALEIGGFDERLPLVFNDVDFCLRLSDAERYSHVAAQAVLMHHEGVSRGRMAEDDDFRRFADRWRSRCPEFDPHGHPLLDPVRDDWLPVMTRPPVALTRRYPS